MKIICIGRNYIDHIKELKNEQPEEPILFMKPDSALVLKGFPFVIPEFTNEVDYEAEVVVKINKVGKYIDSKFAHKYYDEVSLGIDFTARDLQLKLKAKGMPWEKAKGFDNSAVVGNFIQKSELESLNNTSFKMLLNGEVVQEASTAQMIWKIDELIAYVSKYFTLKIGDLIYTGTPSGVGKVNPGDVLEGFIEDKKLFDIQVK